MYITAQDIIVQIILILDHAIVIIANTKKGKNMKRILTGDRPTGKLHIGHYVGSLQTRVALQNDYETFILIADVQALTTHFERPELINESIYNVAMDNIAAGLDPEKVTFIQQSMVPAIAELTIFYSMLTTVNHLLINPTIKSESRNYGFGENDGDFSYDFSKPMRVLFRNPKEAPGISIEHQRLTIGVCAEYVICTVFHLLRFYNHCLCAMQR